MEWSVDGKWLAFAGGNEDSGGGYFLFIVPATGGKPERITLPEKFNHSTLWFLVMVP
jgi:Tol biopolymer transport system component